MSPSPLRVRPLSGWSGPVVFHNTFEVKPGNSSGAVTVASTPFPGAGISVLPSLTPMLSGKVSGSAEIVDRGLPTTAASDTIRGAFPRAPLTVAGRSHRPRKWARSTFRLREAADQLNRNALRPYRTRGKYQTGQTKDKENRTHRQTENRKRSQQGKPKYQGATLAASGWT